MAGKFKVLGTFRVTDRFLIYGDILEGSVASREELHIPLNGSLRVTVEIASVEMVDGTTTGSHVALLIVPKTLEDVLSLEGLNIGGDILQVDPPITVSG